MSLPKRPINSTYLNWIFDDRLEKSVKEFGEFHKLHLSRYDGIVVTGVSGTTYGAVLSYVYSIPLTIVRKMDDTSTHSSFKIEGVKPERFLFVDDFIASGNTLQYVLLKISAEHPNACCVGMYAGYIFPGTVGKGCIYRLKEILGNDIIHNYKEEYYEYPPST